MKQKTTRLIISILFIFSIILSELHTAGAATSTATESPTTPADTSPASTGTPNPTDTTAPTSTPGTSSSSTGKNPFTGSTYTHNAIQDGKNIFLGIDVSYHQGTIDWTKVKASGVQFAILRLGYRGYSTGTLNLDKKFRTYAQDAIDAGLPIGIYFYTEAITEEEARLEAAYCIEQAKDFKITLPVAYDFEPSTNKNGRLLKANLSKSKSTALCRAFCDTITAAGYTPMVYSNKSDLASRINGPELEKDYKIWLANYTTKTTYTGNYEFWQYSSAGKVDGISGSVDCNFWYTDNTTPDATNGTDISGAKIAAITKQIYNKKEKKPAVTVTYKGKKLKKGSDYLLTYSNNTEIGTATATITGINDYTGTKSKNFKIIPKYVVNLAQKETTKQKTVVLKWSKRKPATGYIIYRKDTLNETAYTKIGTIKTNETATFTDAKRAVNRTYYYAVRAYTKVNGTNYYSDYVYLAAASNPAVKTQAVKKATKLYKGEDLENTENEMLVKIPKSGIITHLGMVYLTSDKTVYHVGYTKDDVTYEGYISSDTTFK